MGALRTLARSVVMANAGTHAQEQSGRGKIAAPGRFRRFKFSDDWARHQAAYRKEAAFVRRGQ